MQSVMKANGKRIDSIIEKEQDMHLPDSSSSYKCKEKGEVVPDANKTLVCIRPESFGVIRNPAPNQGPES